MKRRPRPGSGRPALTLSPATAAAVAAMGAQAGGIGTAQVIDRALALYHFHLSLGPDEELVVRDTRTGRCDRLHLPWLPPPRPARQRA